MELARKAHLLLVLLTACLIAAANFAVAQDQLFVEPGLENRINSGEEVDLLVRFRGMPDLSPAYGMDWEERGRWVFDQLDRAVKREQSRIQARFREDKVSFQSLRLGNMMVVEQAGVQAFNELLAAPEVQAINAYPDLQAMPEDKPGGATPQGGGTPVTNLEQIFATDAWQQFGVEGDGIVIGLNDSSPRHTHNLMVDAYRGNTGGGTFDHNYNFYDPSGGNLEPIADFHGTLVLSIMVGDDGTSRTGVAPGADWIACQGCAGTGCGGVIQCLDWMVAPTDVNGNNPDPDKRPNVVNNSWGSCSTNYNGGLYEPIWDSMYAAGVIPYISNGNSGNCGYSSPPGLDTVGNPARGGRVMGIGSTTITGDLGNYAAHSNWGPTDNDNPGLAGGSFDHFGYPDLKPNVVAPGQGVPGAGSGSDTATTTSTGTSFASPHVTGAAAVIMSAAPCIIGDHVNINTILQDTATPVPYDGGPDDADVEPGVNHPNYATGWGEINLLAATQAAVAFCGDQGTIAGNVTDSDTGAPIEGVNVLINNPEPPPDEFIDFTTEFGDYSIDLGVTDGFTYDVEFARNGYQPQTVTGVEVQDGQITAVDIALDPVAGFDVSGVIDDANFPGDFVEAEVRAIDQDGFSYGPVISDAITGAYTLGVPSGFDLDIEVAASGYETATRNIGEVTADTTEDFTLNAGLIDLPATAALSVDRGATGATTITVNNTGTADAEIDLGFDVPGAVLSESFDSGVPSSWLLEDASDPNPCPWVSTEDTSVTDWSGTDPAAAADSDACGSGNTNDTSLITPAIDLSTASSVTLDFDFAMRTGFAASETTLQVSSDGGSSWDTLDSWTTDVAYDATDLEPQSYDLSAYAGASDVHIRWRYEAGWDWWAIVDNVEVTTDNGGAAWASVEPSSITVPQGGSVDVDLTADASMLDVGTYNAPLSVTDGSAYAVTPTDFEVTVNPVPEIILPELVEMTVEFPTTDSTTIDVENIGGAAGDVALTFIPDPFFQDFETGDFPPDGWTVTDDSSPDCPWLTTDDYPMSTFPGLVAGSTRGAAVDSDECGNGVAADTSLITPVLNLGSPTPATLEFDFSQNGVGGTTTTVEATTDGGSNWQVLETYAGDVNTAAAARETVDLAPVAGNTEVQIRFRYTSGWDWYVYVDNVEIDLPPVDWATADPDLVTVPGTSIEQTDIVVDSSLLDGPGVYQATMFGSTDSPFAIAPTQLIVNVEPGADLAGINGTVESLGYCGSNPFNAAGATIDIVGQNDTYTATADENGFYEIFIPSDETPVDITASAPNHLDGTDNGVVLVPADSITVDFSLDLDEPCVDATPASFSSSIDPGNTDTQTLTIGNANGAGQLDWTLEEAEPTVLVANGESGTAAASNSGSHDGIDMVGAFGEELPAATRVGPAGTFDCDGASGLVIHDDGTVENGYSGNPAAATDVTVVEGFEPDGEQVLGTVCIALLSLGPDTRDFELVVYDDDGAGGTPGTEIAAVPATATGLPNGIPDPIVWYTVDLSSENIVVESGRVYIGARWEVSDPNVFLASDEDGAGGLGLGYFTTDSGDWDQLGSGDIFPDYSAMFVRPQLAAPSGCSSPSDVSWLSFSSVTGSIAAGGTENVDVVIDSSGLNPGDYEASICVNSNDPENPVVAVPVSLTVTAPASFATISGNVSSLGYCDSNPFPAAGAGISVVGTSGTPFTTTADANGDYSISVDSNEAPVDVTASAPDHVSETEAGVALSEGGSVTLDFDLQIELGCTTIFEDDFLAILEAGGSETQTMTMTNDGLAESTFTMTTSDTTPAVNVDLMRIGHPGVERSDDSASRAGTIAPIEGEVRSVTVQPRGTAIEVLVVSPDGEAGDPLPPTNLVDALDGFPDVNATLYTDTLANITGADMAPFDVVVTTNNNQWADAGADVAVGDALADYVDGGGKVVLFNFVFDWFGFELAGRYINEEYGPFNQSTADATGDVTMNILETGHPIFDGVTSLQSDTIRINVTAQNDAELIAEWSDGEALIAFNDHAVGFNALYSADGADTWTGDLDIMAYNAVKFIAGASGPVDWLSFSPEAGSVSVSGQSEVDVIFDATGLPDGTYTADIVVEIDEGDGETVTRTVPATMVVGEDGDVLFRDRFEQQ